MLWGIVAAFSRLVAAMIPGALPFDSLCGRSYRSRWFTEEWIDYFLGQGHCRKEYWWEHQVRKLKTN